MLLLSLGLSLVVQRSALPSWVGYWLAFAFILAGFTLARRGVEVFAFRRPADAEHVGVWLAAMSALLVYREPSQAASTMVVIVSLTQAWILYRTSSVIRRDLSIEFGGLLARIFALVVLVLVFALIGRAAVAAFWPEALGLSMHSDKAANTLTILVFLFAGLILNLGLVGMVVSRMVSRLQKMSEHDALTGLLNRRGIEQRLYGESERLLRYGDPFALLAVDVDRFKTVNDEFGHPAGDAVLRALGEVVRTVCRQTDLAGRSGGEEFWLVLPHTSLSGALPVAQRLLDEVRRLEVAELQGRQRLSVSIGLAVVENSDETIEGLLQRADRALYRAKSEGRDRLVVADGAAVSAASPTASA